MAGFATSVPPNALYIETPPKRNSDHLPMTNGRKKIPTEDITTNLFPLGALRISSENFLRHTLLVVLVSAAMFLPLLAACLAGRRRTAFCLLSASRMAGLHM